MEFHHKNRAPKPALPVEFRTIWVPEASSHLPIGARAERRVPLATRANTAEVKYHPGAPKRFNSHAFVVIAVLVGRIPGDICNLPSGKAGALEFSWMQGTGGGLILKPRPEVRPQGWGFLTPAIKRFIPL
jgi:hypothetical protein